MRKARLEEHAAQSLRCALRALRSMRKAGKGLIVLEVVSKFQIGFKGPAFGGIRYLI